MILKASTLTNLTDARYFAAKDIQFLGFNLEEGTPDFLEPAALKTIRDWVEGPAIVGEFSRSPASVVAEAARFFQLDAVQIRAGQCDADLAQLADCQVIYELPAGQNLTFGQLTDRAEQVKPFVKFFLLDLSGQAVLGETQLADLKNFCARFPTLLHGNFDAAYFQTLLETVCPAGLSLRGGEEESVGIKSFDALDEIFDLLTA